MEPIIEIIQKDLKIQVEGAVLKAVQECGVNVNKERLEKALYDARAFYEEGYRDGMASMKHGEWLFDDADECGYTFRCSCCGRCIMSNSIKHDTPNYCPNCGAKMDGGTE